MSFILTIIIAPIVLILGYILTTPIYLLFLGISPKSGNFDRYLSRIILGAVVGILFGLLENYGASNIILWTVFVLSLYLPENTNDKSLSFKLKASRFISFILFKNIIWLIFI